MITPVQAAIIKGLLARGEKQHHIAAFFSINAGRVAEVKSGERYAHVEAASEHRLPTSAEITGGYAIWSALNAIKRAQDALSEARTAINDSAVRRDQKDFT